MALIKFKGNPRPVYNVDDTLAYTYIQVPKIRRSHCDMNAFASHKKLGPYSNSNMFLHLIQGEVRRLFGEALMLKLDSVPANVRVESGNFLTIVTIDI